jgi:iron-sulfur cluster assembly protein
MPIEIPVKITQSAIIEIKNILISKNISDDYGLRIGLKGAGCGATYLLGFDTKSITDDLFLIENIKVFIDRKHLMYLIGVEIDFEAGDEAIGFTFSSKDKLS